MKAIAISAAAAALLALTGCDRLGIGGDGASANESANAATANAADGNASADAAGSGEAEAGGDGGKDPVCGATQASSGGVVLDRNYIAGRWTDNGDCSLAVEFNMDGRFITHDGSAGLWHLQNDRLTMSGGRTLTLTIVPIDQDTMNVVNPDGSLGRSTRC